MNLALPSVIEQIDHPLCLDKGIYLYCKREDLIHPFISGNKWRKLKYNILHCITEKYAGIISFGGAHSNHLYALAHCCNCLDIPLISLVRGDGYDPDNLTLTYLTNKSKVAYIDRSDYRLKSKGTLAKRIISENSDYLVIPEGGSSELAFQGLQEFCGEIPWNNFDHIFISAGTGASAAALIKYADEILADTLVHIVSSLKSDFMENEISNYLGYKSSQAVYHNNYHFGGYGKRPDSLVNFSFDFQAMTQIPLDLIYNAKTVYGMMDLIGSDYFDKGSRILYINTGGRR